MVKRRSRVCVPVCVFCVAWCACGRARTVAGVCVGMSVFLRDDSSQRQQNPRWNPIFIYESRARVCVCVRLMLEFVVGSRTVLRGRVDSRIKSVNVYEMVVWWLP